MAGSGARRAGVCGGVHGCPARSGCDQEPAGEVGQGGRLCVSGDAATGWYSAVHVNSEESHRLKALLGSRDQLVRAKRALGNQVRGASRPFGIRLLSRQGTKKFSTAAHPTARHDAMLNASVTALLEALAAIEAQMRAWISSSGVGAPFAGLLAADERAERRPNRGVGLHGDDRGRGPVSADAGYRPLSEFDAQALPIGRDRCDARHLAARGRGGAALSL